MIGIPLEVKTAGDVQSTAMAFGLAAGDHLTLEPPILCAADKAGKRNLCDARFTTLKSGEVLMLLWTFLQDGEQTISVHRAISGDSGKTWSIPEPTGIEGQITAPLALSSGAVIAASNNRKSVPGIYLWASLDNGKTWDETPILMWNERKRRIAAKPEEIRD
jgi:hypothetical protein